MGLFSALHLAMLAAVMVAAAAAVLVPRIVPGRWAAVAGAVLGAVLVGAEASWWAALIRDPSLVRTHGVPLEICDTNVLVTAAALWWRRRWLVELSWFWSVAGGIPSLLTPSPGAAFPQWLFFQYFVLHGGLVVAASFLVLGVGLTPRRGAVARALLVTAAYAAVMAVVDWRTGLDVLYLRTYPPGPPTLLNLFGPWPWYLVVVAAITVVLFVLLDLPFRAARSEPRVTTAAGAPPR